MWKHWREQQQRNRELSLAALFAPGSNERTTTRASC
jgi:hypothetical protein